MGEKVMINLLDRFIWYAERNRLVEAKRFVEQELNNVRGITEQKCKKRKILNNACTHCTNANCNLNKTPVEMSKDDILRVLEELKIAIKGNDINEVSEQVNNYLLIIKDPKVIQILKNVKTFTDRKQLMETREYIMLEFNNYKGITPVECKKYNKYSLDWYCSHCSNHNCPDNRNN